MGTGPVLLPSQTHFFTTSKLTSRAVPKIYSQMLYRHIYVCSSWKVWCPHRNCMGSGETCQMSKSFFATSSTKASGCQVWRVGHSSYQCVNNDSFIQITKRKHGEIATTKSWFGLHSSDFLSIVQHSSSPFAHQRICLPCAYLQKTSKDLETMGNGSDFTSELGNLNHVQNHVIGSIRKQFQPFESRARSGNSPAIGPIHGSITSAGPTVTQNSCGGETALRTLPCFWLFW